MAEPTSDPKPADDVAPTKSGSGKASAPSSKTDEPTVDPVEELKAAKESENEKTNKGDTADNPMADAVDEHGLPVVGVTPDLYRPLPTDG